DGGAGLAALGGQGVGHGSSPVRNAGGQRSTEQSPAGELTQMRTSSPGSEDSSPVRTLRTVPSVLVFTHEKQMPIRHPNSGFRPRASACSSKVCPVFAADSPERVKLTSPSALPMEIVGGLKNSTRSRGFSSP